MASSSNEALEKLKVAETALSVKKKMLDAKNEEIRELKAELDTTRSDSERRSRRWRRREEELELRLAEEEEKCDRAENQLSSSQAIIDNLEGIVEAMQAGGVAIVAKEQKGQAMGDRENYMGTDDKARHIVEQDHEREMMVSSLQQQLELKQEAVELCEKEIELMRKRFSSCQNNLAKHKTASIQAQTLAAEQAKVGLLLVRINE